MSTARLNVVSMGCDKCAGQRMTLFEEVLNGRRVRLVWVCVGDDLDDGCHAEKPWVA